MSILCLYSYYKERPCSWIRPVLWVQLVFPGPFRRFFVSAVDFLSQAPWNLEEKNVFLYSSISDPGFETAEYCAE